MNTRSNSISFGSTPIERLVVEATQPKVNHAESGSCRSTNLEDSLVSPEYGFTGTLSPLMKSYSSLSCVLLPTQTAKRFEASSCHACAATSSSAKKRFFPGFLFLPP